MKSETSGIHATQPHPATMECLTLLLCLAIAGGSGRAEVIDDFNSTPKWDGENDPSGVVDFQIIDQALVLSGNFTSATDPANPFNTFGNVYYLTNLPVRQRQTLELRADLVSASQDNVFACLITMNANGGEYVFIKDQNEIALLKWSATEGCSVAYWESGPILNQNVVLVLSLTPFGDRLVIETAVKRKTTGQVLYQGPVIVDGPGSDWDVPDPLPHGWQILTPDAGAPSLKGCRRRSGERGLRIPLRSCGHGPGDPGGDPRAPVPAL